MNDMKERIIWLDYFRVLAIYFVVVSHTPVSADFNLPLTYIRMPFFFLCSGLMFNIDKEVDFIVFLKKKAHSLLIPFPSLPITIIPFSSSFLSYMFSPSRNVPYTGAVALVFARNDGRCV